MTFSRTKLSVAILAATSPFAYAEDVSQNTTQLDEVVVSAEEQGKQALGVSVISKEDLEKRPVQNDISEILRTMPGVNLTGNSAGSARGNKRQIDLRGMGPENTLILIDGIPVTSRNAERYGRSGERNTRGDSNWVPVEAIESIEVIRGPAAARYGSGAMGGVVNIKTKPTTNELHGSVTYYTNQPEDSKEGATNRVGFTLSGPIIDNVMSFRLYGNYNKTKADATDINAGANDGSNYVAGREGVRNKDIAGRLDWKLNPNHKLTFDITNSRQGNIYNGDTQNSNGGRNDTTFYALQGSETARLYRQSYSVTHTGKYDWGDSKTYFAWDKTKNSRLPEGLTGGVEGAYEGTSGYTDSVLKNSRFGSEIHVPFTAIFEQMLTVGTEIVHSSLNDPSSMRQTLTQAGTNRRGQTVAAETYTGIENSRSSYTKQSEWAVFLEDNVALTNKTFVTPAIRYDHNSNSGSNVSGGLNVAHNLTENLKVKGGVARAYKAPNLYQSNSNYLTSSNGNGCPIGTTVSCYLRGNSDLKPETSWNKEIGLEYTEGEFTASAAYFHNDYRNKITAGETLLGTTSSGNNAYQWENIKRALIEGVEGNLTLPLVAEKLRWVNNFTYMIQSKNKSTGNPLSVIPKYTVNSSLNWTPTEAWDANLVYTQYGRQKPRSVAEIRYESGSLDTSKIGSYAVWGINVGYNWNKAISLRAGVSNLFDKRIYRTNNGAQTYNEPGRAYYASVKYAF